MREAAGHAQDRATGEQSGPYDKALRPSTRGAFTPTEREPVDLTGSRFSETTNTLQRDSNISEM